MALRRCRFTIYTFSPENVKIIDFTLLSEAVGFRVVKEV